MASHVRLTCSAPHGIDIRHICASWKLNIRHRRPLYGLFMDPNTKIKQNLTIFCRKRALRGPPCTISGRLKHPEQSFRSLIDHTGQLFEPVGRRRRPDLSQHDPREGRFQASGSRFQARTVGSVDRFVWLSTSV